MKKVFSRMGKDLSLMLVLLLPVLMLSCKGNDTGDTPTGQACDVTAFVPDVPPGKETEVMVPMRDCVRMSTDVYLPDGQGPFPALLLRLPYDKERGMIDIPITKLVAMIFVSQGYAVVIQDTRGRFDSEGEWDPFVNEQKDGVDTVRWIEAQPWFDGNLGLFGASYFGFTEYAIARHRPACVRAMAPLITAGNIYSWLYYSGLPRTDMVVKWALGMHEPDAFDSFPQEAFLEAALTWPLREGDDITVGDTPWYNEWLEHPFHDDWYDRFLPRDFMESVETPMLMLSGWFDIFLTNQLEDFEAAKARLQNSDDVRIIIGPWTHQMGFFEEHDLRFPGGQSILCFIEQFGDWYDHHLRGEAMKAAWGPVRIYDPGRARWLDRETLWAENREAFTLHLKGDQGAASCEPSGELVKAPPSQAAQIEYTYDPLEPVVNYGGPLLNMLSGCTREEAHCSRDDVLTFESGPFPMDVTVDGEIHLDLWVSSTAPDTAFIGRLSLIKADGVAYYLRQGAVTLSHREGDGQPSPYTPGDVVKVRIRMPPVLWTLRAGERLRLEISSSSFPSVAQHPNVDQDPWGERFPVSARQTLHLGPDHPAGLVFQVDGTQD